MRTTLRLATLTLLAAALAACATVDRSAPLEDFRDGRYAAARAWYEDDLALSPAEEALDRDEAGTVALIQGDVAAAHRHFMEAFAAVSDLTSNTGETVGAIVGPERTKTWKGDPYERCMTAYYLGVTYWLAGDTDNAAASFKSGLLFDADSEMGEAQSDFGLLWLLLGRAQREAHHEDGGKLALERARKLLPKNPWADPAKTADANVLVVVELGLGPVKVPGGPHGSEIRSRERSYPGAYAEVSADGVSLGRTAQAVDVYEQAITRGDKVIDHINQGKAVFKDAAVVAGAVVLANSRSNSADLVGLGLLLAGLLTPAEADVRQWAILPGEVHVLLATLPPGEHRLTIDVRDASGTRIPELGGEVPVTVREGHTVFAWRRAVPAARRYVEADRMRP